jgi:hypothetical protein
MKRFKMRDVCLAGLCLVALFAFGAVGSASAVPTLLFRPHSSKFPFHLAGIAGKAALETPKGITGVESNKVDVLALVLSPTLVDASFRFLESKTGVGGVCNNEGNNEGNTITLSLLGHLGFAHKGAEEVPGVLLLVPTGFDFTCFKVPIVGTILVLVRGSVIGQILTPKVNGEAASEMLLVFNKTEKGVQELRTFLFNNTKVTADLEASLNEGGFELASQTGEGPLKALPGEGTFLLISP